MVQDLKIEALSAPPAYQVVSREIRKLILSGSLQPGEPFPSELSLAEKLGVNRSTVREGIRQLEADGLVRRSGRRRLFVSIPDTSQIAPRATDAMVLSRITFLELWEVCREVEPLSARLAAIHRTEDQLVPLRANLIEFRDAMATGRADYEIDLAFHALIAEASNNVALLLTRFPIGQLLFPASRHLKPVLEQARPREMAAHEKIFDAVERQDPDEAELWMARHVADLKRGWDLVGLPYDFEINPFVST